MFSVSRKYAIALATTTSSVSIFNLYTICESKKTAAADSKDSEILAVYLNPPSVDQVEKFLSKRGINDRGANMVCFRSGSVRPDHSYIYSPLYGTRAAFRIKGLITVKNSQGDVDQIVGIGRLSNMVGEIADADFTVSMPLTKKVNADARASSEVSQSFTDFRLSLDLPSRLNTKITSMPQWRGRLPASKVLGKEYPSLDNVSYVSLPLKQQIVLEGHICSSVFWGGQESGCVYDRELEEGEEKGGSPQQTRQPVENRRAGASSNGDKDIGESSKSNESEDAQDDECPICKYMKGGPCRDTFVQWQECLDKVKPDVDSSSSEEETKNLKKCYNITTTMLQCMQKYEYYDIMTAGTVIPQHGENAPSTISD